MERDKSMWVKRYSFLMNIVFTLSFFSISITFAIFKNNQLHLKITKQISNVKVIGPTTNNYYGSSQDSIFGQSKISATIKNEDDFWMIASLLEHDIAPLELKLSGFNPSIFIRTSNASKNEKNYRKAITATRGDILYYHLQVVNPTIKAIRAAVHIEFPKGIEYVPGYTKLYFRDDKTGKDTAAQIQDVVTSRRGAMIGEIPPYHWVYIIYKARVSKDAESGFYRTGNQIFNDKGLNESTNSSIVYVK